MSHKEESENRRGSSGGRIAKEILHSFKLTPEENREFRGKISQMQTKAKDQGRPPPTESEIVRAAIKDHLKIQMDPRRYYKEKLPSGT